MLRASALPGNYSPLLFFLFAESEVGVGVWSFELPPTVFVRCHISAPPVPPGGRSGGSSLIKSEAPGALVISAEDGAGLRPLGTCAVRSVCSAGAER